MTSPSTRSSRTRSSRTPSRTTGSGAVVTTAAVRTAQLGLDLAAAPRVVVRESFRLLHRVLGEEVLGSARGNAWAAVCADRERARDRAEVQRLIAAAREQN